MNIIILLVPFSLLLAGLGLAAFWWTFRAGQYDDPRGDAARILYDHLDEGPLRHGAGVSAETGQQHDGHAQA